MAEHGRLHLGASIEGASMADSNDVNIDTETSEENIQYRRIRPTLYIGIGGSGKEVMLRLRRRILQALWNGRRISGFEEFPVVDFMYFDTYTGKAEEHARSGRSDEAEDPLRRLTELPQSDCVQKSLDVAKYLRGREIERYPYVKSWLPEGDLRAIRAEDGAGQVRPISRLLFYDEIGRINDLVKSKARRLQYNVGNQHLQDLGLEIDQEIQIVVIGSLAGGTGSGAFIDMGYLCKSLQDPKPGQVNFIGMAGGAFSRLNERVLANTYAGLMELEYTMRANSQEDYVDAWSDTIRNRALHPYDEVYLVDNKNVSDKATGDRDFLFNMISDSLFEDLHDAALRGKRREDLVNQKQYKIEPFAPPMPEHIGDHAMTFSRAYSSFGQVTLDTSGRLDFERQTTSAASEMVRAFFRLAEQDKENTPGSNEVDEFLRTQLSLGQDRVFDRFPAFLKKDRPTIIEYPLIEEVLTNGETNLLKRVRDDVSKAIDDIPNTQPDMQHWPPRVREAYDNQIANVVANVRSESAHPLLIQLMKTERQRIANRLKAHDGGLRRELYKYLDNPERGGLIFTSRLIQEVRERLTQVIERLRESSAAFRQVSERIHADHYQTAFSNLQKAVKGGFFSRGDEGQARLFIEQISDNLTAYMEFMLRGQACDEVAQLLEEVIEELGHGSALGAETNTGATGIMKEFENGREVVRTTLDELDSELRLLDDARQSKNPFRKFVEGGSLREEGVNQEQFAEWGHKALNESGGSRVLFEQLRNDDQRAAIINRLRGIAREQMRDREARLPSIEQVFDEMDTQRRQRVFKEAMTTALPWLNADMDKMGQRFDPRMLSIFVAVENADEFRRKFNEELFQALPSGFQAKDINYVSSEVRGRVVIYTEISGLALNAIVPMHDDWYSAYAQRSQGEQKLPLHNHRRNDIFAHPTAMSLEEIDRLHDRMQLYLRGIVLGILRRRDNDDRYEMNFGQGAAADWQAVGTERWIYLTGFLRMQRQELENQIRAKEEGLSDPELVLVAANLQWLAVKHYAKRKQEYAGQSERRVGSISHHAAKAAMQIYTDRCARREVAENYGLSVDEAVHRLFEQIDVWTHQIDGSLRDTTPQEANFDPTDADENRAKPKRVIDWSQLDDSSIERVLRGQAPRTNGSARSGADDANVTPPPLPGQDSEQRRFFIAEENQYQGPFKQSELKDLFQEGRLTHTTLVWREGLDTWYEAQQVAEVRQVLQAGTPPPLPTSN
jgi:hypothetical protein